MSIFSAELSDGGLFISDGTGPDQRLVNRFDDQSAALDWWMKEDASANDLANVYRYANNDGRFAYSTSFAGIEKGKDYEIDTVFSPAFQAYSRDIDGNQDNVKPVYELRHDDEQWVYTTQESTIDVLTGQGYQNSGVAFFADSGSWDMTAGFAEIGKFSYSSPDFVFFWSQQHGLRRRIYKSKYGQISIFFDERQNDAS